MKVLTIALAVAAVGQPPAWIQRVVPPPIVAWRQADVLGTAIPEGIAVDRDVKMLTLNVVDSRFDPPRIVRQRDVPGTGVRWLRAGRHDGLARNEIALDAIQPTGDTAYLLLVTTRYTLELVRTVRGTRLRPSALSP